uniref:Exportin 1 n=1 Tax=Malurus cyaneus samueli TaxID=2593467 RepID=A0A8C5T125_9PASS
MPAIMTMLADHAARQLLDFNQKLDINLLDNVVNCLYHGEGAQQRMAQEVLTHLKEHPDAWTRVDTILEFSQNMNTKVSKLTFIYLVFLFLPFINFEEGISFLDVDFLDSNHIFLIVLFSKLALNKNCK